MNNERIKIIYKEPLKAPEIKYIENPIDTFKLLIGEPIEILSFERLYLIHNKNAQKNGLKLNISIDALTSIYGNLIIISKNKDSNSYRSLTNDEVDIYIKKLKDKSFKSSKEEKNLTPKIKMVINWDKVVNSKPEAKLKKFYEERKSKMAETTTKKKLTDEEIAKRIREILLKIKNDPRLTEEEKSNQTRIIMEKLKKVKGIEFKQISEEPIETSASNSSGNIITTSDTTVNEIPVFDANEVLKMILAMQNTIIQFIKNNTEEQ